MKTKRMAVQRDGQGGTFEGTAKAKTAPEQPPADCIIPVSASIDEGAGAFTITITVQGKEGV